MSIIQIAATAGALLLAQAAPAQDYLAVQTKAALEKFDHDKFGMFIHWGLYAIPAGEWNGQYVPGIGEWIMNHARIPVKDYARLSSKFDPVKFSESDWVGLAHSAGMRYMVITAKHHDGFAMYGSKVSRYNIVNATPYGKDPMIGLAAMARAYGLGFGFYYSQDQDWHEPGGRGNTWDFPAKKDPRDAENYFLLKALPQVYELVSNYGPLNLMWFDTPGMLTEQQVTTLWKAVKGMQPGCLLNSRIGHGRGDYLQTGDNAIPIEVYSKQKWEVPATLNDTWGFKKNDTHWKDPADLIAKLADIVSKGGNYLLNVGPTAEGVIPEASQRILLTIGKWLSANGESIYGTSPSPFYFPDITWRVTLKPRKVYLHLINWPRERDWTFEPMASKVTAARFLAGGRKIAFRQNASGIVHFTLPPEPPDPYDSVIVLDIADAAPKVRPGFGKDELPSKIDVYAWSARLRGEETRYDKASMSATGFRKAEALHNDLAWYPYEALSGDYSIELTYALDAAAAGSGYRIGTAHSQATGVLESTGGLFHTVAVPGTLHIDRTDQTINFSLPDDDKSASVRVQKITLVSRRFQQRP
ncbi:MAG TPA: alpha-L-fucosidase [Bryobacteraceae bacterium]|jgi:alpha-L-fucosidase